MPLFYSGVKMIRKFFLLVVVVFSVTTVEQSNAALISQISSFSAASSLAAVNSHDTISINPFDPLSGSLDEVRISISGTMQLDFTNQPQIIGMGVPVPYSYNVLVMQTFTGVGTPAPFTFNVQDTGQGLNLSLGHSFDYNYTFNDASHLSFFLVSNTIDLYQSIAIMAGSTTYPLSLNLISGGDMTVEYSYTSPITSTPVPSAVFLLGSGLLGIAGVKRKIQII
ncbi:MAG: hypothetical protein KKD32_06395 [Proteobacteria bacterium]|nr:hypothetical protein [Pseudomonadota bacterium]